MVVIYLFMLFKYFLIPSSDSYVILKYRTLEVLRRHVAIFNMLYF